MSNNTLTGAAAAAYAHAYTVTRTLAAASWCTLRRRGETARPGEARVMTAGATPLLPPPLPLLLTLF